MGEVRDLGAAGSVEGQAVNFYCERKRSPDTFDEVFTFRGEVRESDLLKIKLDPLDRAVINDVGSDPKASAADFLLALEILFRRHTEQNSAGDL